MYSTFINFNKFQSQYGQTINFQTQTNNNINNNQPSLTSHKNQLYKSLTLSTNYPSSKNPSINTIKKISSETGSFINNSLLNTTSQYNQNAAQQATPSSNYHSGYHFLRSGSYGINSQPTNNQSNNTKNNQSSVNNEISVNSSRGYNGTNNLAYQNYSSNIPGTVNVATSSSNNQQSPVSASNYRTYTSSYDRALSTINQNSANSHSKQQNGSNFTSNNQNSNLYDDNNYSSSAYAQHESKAARFSQQQLQQQQQQQMMSPNYYYSRSKSVSDQSNHYII